MSKSKKYSKKYIQNLFANVVEDDLSWDTKVIELLFESPSLLTQKQREIATMVVTKHKERLQNYRFP